MISKLAEYRQLEKAAKRLGRMATLVKAMKRKFRPTKAQKIVDTGRSKINTGFATGKRGLKSGLKSGLRTGKKGLRTATRFAVPAAGAGLGAGLGYRASKFKQQ